MPGTRRGFCRGSRGQEAPLLQPQGPTREAGVRSIQPVSARTPVVPLGQKRAVVSSRHQAGRSPCRGQKGPWSLWVRAPNLPHTSAMSQGRNLPILFLASASPVQGHPGAVLTERPGSVQPALQTRPDAGGQPTGGQRPFPPPGALPLAQTSHSELPPPVPPPSLFLTSASSASVLRPKGRPENAERDLRPHTQPLPSPGSPL